MFDFMKIILYSKNNDIKNIPIFQAMNLLSSIQEDVETLIKIVFDLASVGYTYDEALETYYYYLEVNKLSDLLILINNKKQKQQEDLTNVRQ